MSAALFPVCGDWGLNWSHQAWQEASLLAVPFHWPDLFVFCNHFPADGRHVCWGRILKVTGSGRNKNEFNGAG